MRNEKLGVHSQRRQFSYGPCEFSAVKIWSRLQQPTTQPVGMAFKKDKKPMMSVADIIQNTHVGQSWTGRGTSS